MGKTISKRIRESFYTAVLRKAPKRLLKAEVTRRQIALIQEVYGSFADGNDYANDDVPNALAESEQIMGEMVHAIRSVAKPTDLMLLPGERRSARDAYSKISGIPESQILTAGLHEDMDFSWNYELPPPVEIPKVDLLASHAMIEHLINPYRHVTDCYGLLKNGGCMIFHTVIPGFQYHRYPVDCLRYFPDWFEEVASRLGAEVVFRSISTTAHIVYTIRKPN